MLDGESTFALYSHRIRGVAQLVARLLWEQEVPGSNPGTPTIAKHRHIKPEMTVFYVQRTECQQEWKSCLFIILKQMDNIIYKAVRAPVDNLEMASHYFDYFHFD